MNWSWFPLVGLGVLSVACFDPDLVMEQSDGATAGTASAGPDTGTACSPGESQPCICDGGSSGTQTCADDGSSFGSCECDGSDSTTTPDPTVDPTTGPPPECTSDDDCASMAEGECEQGICGDDGTCSVEPRAEGTPCGDASEVECSAADTCDGEGTCAANDLPDGAPCPTCPLGVCSCLEGACGDCTDFAPSNNFVTDRSVQGWDLTGGWGLYREAPQSFVRGSVRFEGQVFGTDGNRMAPYPSSEDEESYARTPPTVLPATLEFLSWNVDEGANVDNKTIRISTDGGMTFIPVVDCNAGGAFPFCQFRNDERAADDWDPVSIPLPPRMVGQVGIVEFTYDTLDSCCNFEQGWYIDATNFATECACTQDASCLPLGGDCGAGICGEAGECELDPAAADTACGDATDNDCNAPDTCDGVGYCTNNEALTGLSACSDCPAGAGGCNTCQAAVCVDCLMQPAENDFSNGAGSVAGWVVDDLSGTGADWQIFFSAPQTTEPMSMPTPLSFGPSFGTDGNRQVPYTDALEEAETSSVTTPPDVVPAAITFASWHADEGSNPYDTKRIELSVDDGATWNVLIDCEVDMLAQPFCLFEPGTRDGADWDLISLDTAAFVDQTGILRFTYDTVDTCCGDERGWFIDNLNFARYCLDFPFPQ